MELPNIGYASLALGIPGTKMSSTIQKNASSERLLSIIEANLNALDKIIDYNVTNGIRLFRISSDLIPFGSSPVNKLPWWDFFSDKLDLIGTKAIKSGLRLSMHPGQYTVLNSPNSDVVSRAIEDLVYHQRVLESLKTGPEHKIVLHIGGIYHDKKEAVKRFIANYRHLDRAIREKLIIENDDRSFNIDDALEIGSLLKIPVVFDNLHHRLNPDGSGKSEHDLVKACSYTWQENDGRQKIHYSQQNRTKKPGAHSSTINIEEFMAFCNDITDIPLDIMLEVKDKNLSAIKCKNCLDINGKMTTLKKEWSLYRYKVMENSPGIYRQIEELLRNTSGYPALSFYQLVEKALRTEISTDNAVEAARLVMEQLKFFLAENEKISLIKSLESYKRGIITLKTFKNRLLKMAHKYGEPDLFESYYFLL